MGSIMGPADISGLLSLDPVAGFCCSASVNRKSKYPRGSGEESTGDETERWLLKGIRNLTIKKRWAVF
jgi:hypothetical protein